MSQNDFLHSVQIKMDDLVAFAKNNLLVAGAAAVIIIGGGGGFYWYHQNSIQKEQEAHTILVDCLAQAEEAAQGKAQWADVVAMCQAGYEKFANTKVAPYILAVQIDALLGQEKQQEAFEKLGLMLNAIGSSSPLYPLYKLKHALLSIDLPEQQSAGLHELEALAADTKNIYNDAAQFYLGLYYRTHDQQGKALEVWQSLVARNEHVIDNLQRSSWASLAEEKLNGLT